MTPFEKIVVNVSSAVPASTGGTKNMISGASEACTIFKVWLTAGATSIRVNVGTSAVATNVLVDSSMGPVEIPVTHKTKVFHVLGTSSSPTGYVNILAGN